MAADTLVPHVARSSAATVFTQGWSLSSMRKDVNYLLHFSGEEGYKVKTYRQFSKARPILKRKCFSSRLTAVFAQSIEATC